MGKSIITELEIQMGRRFREIREARNITLEKIQEDTGINIVYIHLFEQGRWVPSYFIFAVLAAYINISGDYFLGMIHDMRVPLEMGKKQWDDIGDFA